jgi:hypothetical protein
MTIVRTAYRYKRPPRRKKPVTLEVPAVVRSKQPRLGKRFGTVGSQPETAGTQPNDDRKPVIVTARRPKAAASLPPDLPPETPGSKEPAADERCAPPWPAASTKLSGQRAAAATWHMVQRLSRTAVVDGAAPMLNSPWRFANRDSLQHHSCTRVFENGAIPGLSRSCHAQPLPAHGRGQGGRSRKNQLAPGALVRAIEEELQYEDYASGHIDFGRDAA